jgi:hypothetical protein
MAIFNMFGGGTSNLKVIKLPVITSYAKSFTVDLEIDPATIGSMVSDPVNKSQSEQKQYYTLLVASNVDDLKKAYILGAYTGTGNVTAMENENIFFNGTEMTVSFESNGLVRWFSEKNLYLLLK